MILFNKYSSAFLWPKCLFLFFTLWSGNLFAQELNCTVTVNADRVQTQERRVFTDMENAFAQFLNSRKWTQDEFTNEERINCTMAIQIENMPSIGTFNATVQIQSSRPIYGTSYETLVMNYADREWSFEYVESLPLDFNENAYTSNLTSLLGFYALVIIGMDYDTFSPKAGEPFFERALNIVTYAQQADRPGWNPFGGNRNNRYWLIENLTNQQLAPVREGYYTYHRKALDTFLENPDESRQEILGLLEKIDEVSKIVPNSVYIRNFFNAKSDELLSIFTKGNLSTRRNAFELLTKLDPSGADKYQGILSN